MNMAIVFHPLKYIANSGSKVLILGSLPSPLSRQKQMYYANPQNRFWAVLSKLFDEELPNTNEDKIDFLLSHHIALWDVIDSCDITGASDSSIKNAKPNDIPKVISTYGITQVFCTGKKAYNLLKKFFPKIDAKYLPSTSPANCAKSIDDLFESYSIIKNYL